MMNSSMRESFSTPSKNPPVVPNVTVRPGDRPWRVRLHREVAKLVAYHGRDNDDFTPTIGELIELLETDPKTHPKKRGKLRAFRAAAIVFRTEVWRAVFTLNEVHRTVDVVALAPHDDAYREAQRRA
jgi:hypothetical protein